ncbi:hypothetical protein CEP54_007482 [Fusarium duplospermum]|uniref:Uncharacterized protein n=1 Tax=Fusarium duplospermum TaxID=1325734 RepID=A0A428Q1C0_9HYPO|nr:hypothetical protein CEP54_007482 [Fusarium duplospermum]
MPTVDTGNDFTLDIATERDFIGLASFPNGTSSVPTTTFKPEHNNQTRFNPSTPTTSPTSTSSRLASSWTLPSFPGLPWRLYRN